MNGEVDGRINGAPRVTVILCCYSHEQYFLPAVQSILVQTAPVECIILNNGANPSYSELIQQIADMHGLKVVEVHPNTYGLALRSLALPRVETDYVAILHDDDLYLPDKIERSLAALDASGADYLVTNNRLIDERGGPWHGRNDAVNNAQLDGGETRGELIADMVRPPGCRLHFSTLVMRSDLAKRTVLGNPFWPRIADAVFWVNLLLDDSLTFEILPEFLSKVRIHRGNDRLYDKFAEQERLKHTFLLAMSEIELIGQVLRTGSPKVIVEFLKAFIGFDVGPDLLTALIMTAVVMDKSAGEYWISKLYMISLLCHRSLEIDFMRTCELIEKLSGRDANHFMSDSYDRFAAELLGMRRVVAEMASRPQAEPALLQPVSPQAVSDASAPPQPIAAFPNVLKNYREADVSFRWMWRHPKKAMARGLFNVAQKIGGQTS
jgi:glycosyltransferase involved in cell wall biosynthesis